MKTKPISRRKRPPAKKRHFEFKTPNAAPILDAAEDHILVKSVAKALEGQQ
jgi:hypothetical protein